MNGLAAPGRWFSSASVYGCCTAEPAIFPGEVRNDDLAAHPQAAWTGFSDPVRYHRHAEPVGGAGLRPQLAALFNFGRAPRAGRAGRAGHGDPGVEPRVVPAQPTVSRPTVSRPGPTVYRLALPCHRSAR